MYLVGEFGGFTSFSFSLVFLVRTRQFAIGTGSIQQEKGGILPSPLPWPYRVCRGRPTDWLHARQRTTKPPRDFFSLFSRASRHLCTQSVYNMPFSRANTKRTTISSLRPSTVFLLRPQLSTNSAPPPSIYYLWCITFRFSRVPIHPRTQSISVCSIVRRSCFPPLRSSLPFPPLRSSLPFPSLPFPSLPFPSLPSSGGRAQLHVCAGHVLLSGFVPRHHHHDGRVGDGFAPPPVPPPPPARGVPAAVPPAPAAPLPSPTTTAGGRVLLIWRGSIVICLFVSTRVG